jgi:hypothetical protein
MEEPMDWFNRKRVAELEAEIKRLKAINADVPVFVDIPRVHLPDEARKVIPNVLREVEYKLAKVLKAEVLRVVMEIAERIPDRPARIAVDTHRRYIHVEVRIPELACNIQSYY